MPLEHVSTASIMRPHYYDIPPSWIESHVVGGVIDFRDGTVGLVEYANWSPPPGDAPDVTLPIRITLLRLEDATVLQQLFPELRDHPTSPIGWYISITVLSVARRRGLVCVTTWNGYRQLLVVTSNGRVLQFSTPVQFQAPESDFTHLVDGANGNAYLVTAGLGMSITPLTVTPTTVAAGARRTVIPPTTNLQWNGETLKMFSANGYVHVFVRALQLVEGTYVNQLRYLRFRFDGSGLQEVPIVSHESVYTDLHAEPAVVRGSTISFMYNDLDSDNYTRRLIFGSLDSGLHLSNWRANALPPKIETPSGTDLERISIGATLEGHYPGALPAPFVWSIVELFLPTFFIGTFAADDNAIYTAGILHEEGTVEIVGRYESWLALRSRNILAMTGFAFANVIVESEHDITPDLAIAIFRYVPVNSLTAGEDRPRGYFS